MEKLLRDHRPNGLQPAAGGTSCEERGHSSESSGTNLCPDDRVCILVSVQARSSLKKNLTPTDCDPYKFERMIEDGCDADNNTTHDLALQYARESGERE
jgi:hypothetical protein